MSWPIIFFAKVLNHLGRYSKGWFIVTAFIAWVTQGPIGLISWGVSQIGNLLGMMAVEQFQNVDIGAIESIGAVNAIIPVTEMLAVLTALVTAWVLLICIRWIKSFFPTVAN